MTEEEIAALRRKIRDSFDKHYMNAFETPKRFFLIESSDGGFKKYISPVAQNRGARDLFVPSTAKEFKEFFERTGGVINDELQPGDCVCDVKLDKDGKEVRTYLKYDPAHFKAKEVYIAPNQIYSSIEEYKNDYFGQETDN